MKAFVSVDLEGMPYVVIPGHLTLKGVLYNEARKISTEIALAAAEALNENGFDEIIIADSHGPMVNLLVDELPEYVEIVRGYPRPVCMLSGIKGCDAALFLGYHAKFGTARSTFDHTYSGRTINELKVNGIAVSEFLLNAYTAGDLNVPVILVAGEKQLLKDDVKKYAPWAVTVALKDSFSRVSAKSYSMVKIKKELKQSVKKAVVNFNQNKTKPLTAQKPVKINVTFLASHFADVAELSPLINRIDGLHVEYAAGDMIEAYKLFELLVLAGSGVSALLEKLR
jgi:D-amino peptidase